MCHKGSGKPKESMMSDKAKESIASEETKEAVVLEDAKESVVSEDAKEQVISEEPKDPKPSKAPKKSQKKNKTFSRITTLLLVIILLVGIGLLAYPSVSDWWNQRVQSRAISTYDEAVANLTDEQYDTIIAAAEEYNTRLYEAGVSAFYNPELVEGYEETLDITGTGIMGYITIDKINVQLPIYHGTSVDVLQVAAGHLEGTSFPVGGESTHAVIMAHRGLTSARLFTDLDEMAVGDTFTITVLNRVLTYEVDLISIVLPDEVSSLQIEEGMDYVTLLTCTPYGVNTHRLLVRGHRIDTPEGESTIVVTGEANIIQGILVAPFIAVILLIPFVLWVFIHPGKGKKRKEKKDRKLKRKHLKEQQETMDSVSDERTFERDSQNPDEND